MPKFLYTVIITAGVFWILSTRYMAVYKPETAWNIIFLLGLILIALSHTLVLPFYYYYYKKAPDFINLRRLYRRAYRWSLFLSGGIVGYLGLKAFNIAKPINLILYFILYIAVFIKLKK